MTGNESLSPLLTPEADRVATCPSQLHRQTFFTDHTLTGSPTFFRCSVWIPPSDSAGRAVGNAPFKPCSPSLFHQSHFGWEQSPPTPKRGFAWTCSSRIPVVAGFFDSKEIPHYKVPTVTTDPIVLSDLLAELALRQLPCGGWAALASSSQPAIEPTCYSALALDSVPVGDLAHAQDFLLRTQNPNGSWPVFPGDDQRGGWITSLVVMALRDLVPAIPARLQGLHWLLNCAGKEANWFWKWKFRTADRHVRFNPDKYGWPWFPDTVSWVVPTSFAILALNQIPCACGGLEQIPFRVNRGVEMLMDRVCPGGGWNAGNGVVYGVALAPHADDTAIALLALRDRAEDPVVQGSVDYLERTAPALTAPCSLAWAILALAAHRRPIASLRSSLVALPDLSGIEDTSTLALACLAIDYRRALSAFGVTV